MTTVPGWTDGLPYRLFRANQAVQRLLAQQTTHLGVTITQLGFAVHLDALGRLSGSDLARHFGVSPQSASMALGGLERLGWVERTPHPVHKRVIWFGVTPLGSEQAQAGRAILGQFHAMLEERLSTSFVSDLQQMLLELSADLVGEEQPPQPLWPA